MKTMKCLVQHQFSQKLHLSFNIYFLARAWSLVLSGSWDGQVFKTQAVQDKLTENFLSSLLHNEVLLVFCFHLQAYLILSREHGNGERKQRFTNAFPLDHF